MSPVGNRYEPLSEVGKGGMAHVLKVLDTRTGKTVALKRPLPQEDQGRWQRLVAHLEREFHTLAQLAHPGVVSVYDYGHDATGPYYTMELLDGGDLEQLAPMPWRDACAAAVDVCGALSLVHSRRWVHRDVGPRNIRRTSDGRAKLIDFGAMTPMGPVRRVVGTPPICAPEIVHLQPLDGRTDLYALGATTYYALTGKMPYPARTFAKLEDLWRVLPPAPSAHQPGIPPELDRLVLDLLQLEPSARPRNAAEVIQRLCAIADLKADATVEVRHAFLSTPTLAGRDAAIRRLRGYADELPKGTGKAVQVRGPAGVGRSRLLDAFALESKLSGATVVRADATDNTGEELAVGKALLRRLHDPTFGAGFEASVDLAESQPPLQATEVALRRLRTLLLDASRQRPLALVVDDVHRIDTASIALLASLAQHAQEAPLLVITSAPTGGSQKSEPERALTRLSRRITLRNLTLENTDALLRSVFGEVPNIERLAHRLFAITGGRPRDLMLLAQHLVDHKVIVYEAGCWTLPDSIEAQELPQGLAAALQAVVAHLSPGALDLAITMALSDVPRFSFEECLRLAGHQDAAQLLRALDELTTAGVIAPVDEDYELGQQGWASALLGSGPAPHPPTGGQDLRQAHQRLAEVYLGRGDEFRAAQHLFGADDRRRGVEVLLRHAVDSQRRTDETPQEYVKLLEALPKDWLQVYDQALEACEDFDLPSLDRYRLRRRAAGAAAHDERLGEIHRYYRALFDDLRRDCGLDLWDGLDRNLEPIQRIQTALAAAQQRRQRLPENNRGFEPGEAVGQVVLMVQTAMGKIAGDLDLELLHMLPSLAPVAPLAPVCDLMHIIVRGLQARMAARTEETLRIYRQALQRVQAPDGGGLTGTYRSIAESALMYLLCNLEAGMGLSSALDWARRIQKDPMHEANGYQGQGLYYLWQGDLKQAAQLSELADQLMIEGNRRRAYPGTHLLRELPAYAMADDLTQVTQLVNTLERLAQTRPGWQPVLHYARGQRARIRGDYPSALQELTTTLSLCQAGVHQIWAYAAGARLHVLCNLERWTEACHMGARYLESASAAEQGYLSHYIRMPLAKAQVRCGHRETALATAQAVIEGFVGLGSTGLNLYLAYETRADLALVLEDATASAHYCGLAEAQLSRKASGALWARYQRIRRRKDAAAGWCAPASASTQIGEEQSGIRAQSAQLASRTEQQADQILSSILEESGATQGFLYSFAQGKPHLSAHQADHMPSPEVNALVHDYLCADLGNSTCTVTADESTAGDTWSCPSGRSYRPVLLAFATGGTLVTDGLALVELTPGKAFNYPVNTTRRLASLGHRG